MNILYIGGEAANFVLNLCNALCEEGHNITCVVQNVDTYDKKNPVICHKNLKVISVDYKTQLNIEEMDKILDIKPGKYDIIYGSHTSIIQLVHWLGTTYNLPWGIMILDIPTDLINLNPVRMGAWKTWFKDLVKSKYITFNTHVSRDEYYNFTNQQYDDDHIITYATRVPNKYQLSGLDKKENYVVSVFRLTQIKNGTMIVAALATMKNPPTYIIIGRDSGDLANIKQLAMKYGIKIIYCGTTTEEEKFNIIKNSSCLIYPQLSAYIGGLSPWESMMIGKPTVVSDYKVLKNLYKEHTIYFDHTSVKDLADKIIEAINSNDKQKIIEANKYANNEASFNIMAKKLIKVFEKMLVSRQEEER